MKSILVPSESVELRKAEIIQGNSYIVTHGPLEGCKVSCLSASMIMMGGYPFRIQQVPNEPQLPVVVLSAYDVRPYVRGASEIDDAIKFVQVEVYYMGGQTE